MQANKYQNQNNLDLYRRRMRFSLKHVAHLLGHKDGSVMSLFERGERLPSLANALSLGIILRVPVEFLFPSLYDSLKTQIRRDEERMIRPTQQALF